MITMMSGIDMNVHRGSVSKNTPFYTSGFSLSVGVGAGVFV